jgi:hypothetical protein
MDGRRKPGGTGLLGARHVRLRSAVLVFLLLPGRAFGAGEDGLPELLVRSFPDHAVVGAPWLLTILVDHPLPEEIDIRMPPLPAILTLDTVRRDLRFIRWPADMGKRWTAVEYRFIPLGGGTARIGPFEIRGPWGSLTTGPVMVEVWTEENRREEKSGPVFSWRGPSELVAGEAALFDLVVTGGESPLPDPSLFMPEIPPGAILEREPSDVPAGSFLRLRVVPLAPPLFSLPSYRVRHGHADFTVPPLRIPVRAAMPDGKRSPGAWEPGSPGPAALTDRAAMPDDASTPVFPEGAAFSFDRGRRVFLPLRGGYEAALNRAEELIAAGDPVRALAELRRNERDSVAGPLFAAPRRELERAMGFQDGGDEKWRPGAPFRILLAGCPVTALLLVILRLKKKVTFLPPWGYRGIMVILFAGAAAGLTGGGIRLPFAASRGERSAVTRECTVRRVPDCRALESFRFAGGSLVRVRAVQEPWAWVEAGEGTEGGAGWASLDDIVFY